MKISAAFVLLSAATAHAVYSGDVVQYWNNQVVLGLQNANPQIAVVVEGWMTAYVHTAIFAAAEASRSSSRAMQQVAVTHAAHAALGYLVPAQQPAFFAAAKSVLAEIGAGTNDAEAGRQVGEAAFAKVQRARAGDEASAYAPYDYMAAAPGVYQPTPPDNGPPAGPHGGAITPFGGVSSTDIWKAPPDLTKAGYDYYVKQIIAKGGKTSTNRTTEETEIGYFWLVSSVQFWNTISTAIVGTRNAGDVYESAKFYALVNWGLANAGFVGWKTKYTYNAWRPITAIRYPGVYLSTGENISNPTWEPLVDTPNHPEYLSGHSVYGGVAGGIFTRYFGTALINPPLSLSSNVSTAGPITRTFSNVDDMVVENGNSRIYIGAHFEFASVEGVKAGKAAADKVWTAFQEGGRGY
ncbi:phosphatidic acid phosphatase type 2/haloperoxidase [Coprinopsis sp. MPI-PUGE-AT-0042]|nr:phosphatidic acid phosphatase type 2/haloperoxidase [Coprinopsis sp. MPI-PUGE-AT-0042]